MTTDNLQIARPERRPSPGRQAYLRQRREATRAAILQAARGVFAQCNYIDAKIEDIIRTAGVSRATFYAHFESKLELAYAIYDEIVPQTTALFDALPEAGDAGIDAIKAWLRAFADIHVEHRYVTPLIAQLQLFESGFRQRVLNDSEGFIDRLARSGVRGFAAVAGTGPEARRQRVHARLVTNRAAAVCAEIARGETSPADTEIVLDLVGRELLEFMAGPR